MSSSIVMESSNNSIDIDTSMVNEEEQEQLLPEDIVFEILLWLPVVSLLRFKSVCKSWCSLIQTSRFISLHKHKDTSHNNLLLMLPSPLEVVLFKLLSSCGGGGGNNNNNKFQTYENLGLPEYLKIYDWPIRNAKTVICDGIICLHTLGDEDDVSLWNPATKQFRILPRPQPPSPGMGNYYCCMLFGFGFDVETNDYKVVRVDLSKNITSANTYNQFEVYSLTNNSWKSLDFVLPINYVISDPKMPLPYHNGGIYCWIVKYIVDQRIVSFDFSKEIFGTISLPNDPTFQPMEMEFSQLAILREKLAVINRDIDFTKGIGYYYHIWVMNEFGVTESWTKLYTVGPFSYSHPIGFPKNEDLFLLVEIQQRYHLSKKKRYHLRLCDLVTGQINNLPVPDSNFDVEAAVYKESLLPIQSGVIK